MSERFRRWCSQWDTLTLVVASSISYTHLERLSVKLRTYSPPTNATLTKSTIQNPSFVAACRAGRFDNSLEASECSAPLTRAELCISLSWKRRDNNLSAWGPARPAYVYVYVYLYARCICARYIHRRIVELSALGSRKSSSEPRNSFVICNYAAFRD